MKVPQYSLGIFYLAVTAFSQATFAEDQERIWRSSYFLGRGDAGISIADNEDAIFYNPAGIALGKGIYKRIVLVSPHIEISEDTRNVAREVTQSPDSSGAADIAKEHIGKNQHAGIYNFTGILFRRVAIGVVSSATTDLLVYKSPDAGGLESAKASFVQNNGLTFTLGESLLGDHLQVGTTLKYLQRGQAKFEANVTDIDQVSHLKSSDILGLGYGGGADVGLMLRGGSPRINPSCGLTVMNVGGMTFKAANDGTTALDSLHQVVNVGCAVEPGTKTSHFKLIADYWDLTSALTNDAFKKTHVGGELALGNLMGFTAGLAQGSPSAGFYLDIYLMRLDLGAYTQEVDDRVGVRSDKRYYLRLMMKI